MITMIAVGLKKHHGGKRKLVMARLSEQKDKSNDAVSNRGPPAALE